jgi:hypothetical protein
MIPPIIPVPHAVTSMEELMDEIDKLIDSVRVSLQEGMDTATAREKLYNVIRSTPDSEQLDRDSLYRIIVTLVVTAARSFTAASKLE